MNIALCYNVKKSNSESELEFDSPETTLAQKSAIESLGHKVILIEADENAFFNLKKLQKKIDLVFNIAEGMWGDARESQIPMFCEILKLPYTHSGVTTNAIALDKAFAKLVLKGADGINVPDSHVVSSKKYVIPKRLKYPLIVKPNKEGSSKGVMDANVVRNKKDLARRIKTISENFTKEVLVEEYIEGREFTVSVMGNEILEVLPIVEQKFDFLPKGMNKIASFELKWLYEDNLKDLKDAYDCPAKLTKSEKKLIEETSKEVYRLLDVVDCARIDYRMDKAGKLYFIEINTLPGMIPGEDLISYFPLAARAAGISYNQLVSKIIKLARKRYKI